MDHEAAYALFCDARDASESGELELAVSFLHLSLEKAIHFKTLELLGDTLIQQKKPKEAIIPLAASASLNRGPRASYLLAQAFFELEQDQEALTAAEEALRRNPKYKMAAELIDLIKAKK
ncbi:MAG: hypothetical protein ACE37H_17730 [Phycisphaeraceae bacterium]